MRTKTISFTFAYQYADYDELVKDIIEKMYNVGLEMANGKNMAICYEGESEKKEAENDYEKLMHVIIEKCQSNKQPDPWSTLNDPPVGLNMKDETNLKY